MARQKQVDLYTRELFEKTGLALGQIGRAFEGYRELSVQPTGLSIRAPEERGGEYLAVIRGLDDEGAPVVAFSSATDLCECVRGIEARINNGTLKWRTDDYAT